MELLKHFFIDHWIVLDVGTILWFLLGLVWYSPNVFGRKWLELQDIKTVNPKAYTFFFTLLMNIVVCISVIFICFMADINTYSEALQITILISAGILSPILGNKNMWLYGSWELFLIELWYYMLLILMISSFYVYHHNFHMYM